MDRVLRYAVLTCLIFSVVSLLALQHKVIGFGSIGFGVLLLLFIKGDFKRHLGLVYLSLAILGSVKIGTTTAYPDGAVMSLALLAAVAMPYLVLRFIYQEHTIKFPFALLDLGVVATSPTYL